MSLQLSHDRSDKEACEFGLNQTTSGASLLPQIALFSDFGPECLFSHKKGLDNNGPHGLACIYIHKTDKCFFLCVLMIDYSNYILTRHT